MTFGQFEKVYWKHYLKLEEDFMIALDYVEFDECNLSTHSLKFMGLLLTIGSEIDNVFREVCNLQHVERTSISNYAPIVLDRYPSITSQKVCNFNNDIVLSPFSGWTVERPSESLRFWELYNIVKHKRIENYKAASLETVANALAALFILEMFEFHSLYNTDATTAHNLPSKESNLFYLDSWSEHMRTSAVKYHYTVIDDDDHRVLFERK